MKTNNKHIKLKDLNKKYDEEVITASMKKIQKFKILIASAIN